MKRIKNFTLRILGATILSLGLYACSNDDEAIKEDLKEFNKLKQSKFTNIDFEHFVKSEEFNRLSENFDIRIEDLSREDFEEVDIKDDVRYSVINLKNNKKGLIWLYQNANDEFIAFYEDLKEYNELNGGKSKVYFSSKYELMNILFTPVKRNGIKFMEYKIDKVFVENSTSEKYIDCVTRVYQAAKKACEADALCDTLCDFTPGCHTNMLIAAGVTCM